MTSSGNVSLVPSCQDGVKNEKETDVDCGGNKCPKCDVRKTCRLDSDCNNVLCINSACHG